MLDPSANRWQVVTSRLAYTYMCRGYKINRPTVEVKPRRSTEETSTQKIESREAKVRKKSVFLTT